MELRLLRLDQDTVLNTHDTVHAFGEVRIVGGDESGEPWRRGPECIKHAEHVVGGSSGQGCRSARRPTGRAAKTASARAMATRCCSPPESNMPWAVIGALRSEPIHSSNSRRPERFARCDLIEAGNDLRDE